MIIKLRRAQERYAKKKSFKYEVVFITAEHDLGNCFTQTLLHRQSLVRQLTD